ncbi:flagellar biosynthesis anti-sigma factor FlgM [Brachyspira aalborgi]|uniref:Flagellar biosynthesis anti-sigma factor FlgM n=1 Tax=Brachyspira aalborgi TaxID=29522 RepID=A0AB38PYN4_9SPIR|nr:flagellar biosynthesis anti-sigma factor FlgM [Brachyspira aalborgi]TXJ15499.1 flagellar biosynthesis anti-sigma factor FlgM [Brachyspira aalborgi]TXJ17864.1 flagellar biosynthesis anti-sigma factor FlgM [Brachyspira aalborgi]TXJ23817.1 flagellar biosynthesis anti-sigma factor FlgM [Brachyspira aalborgi]TXJ48029.1 flagellar biosynthesis anti-sigma factor FlgM [Brachyspira aalborgi]
MTIDKIGGAANIQQKSNVRQNEKVSNIGSDRIDISKESKLALQNEKLISIIKDAPDIREEKVTEAKKRLELYMQDGALREEVLNSLASSIIDSMPTEN